MTSWPKLLKSYWIFVYFTYQGIRIAFSIRKSCVCDNFERKRRFMWNIIKFSWNLSLAHLKKCSLSKLLNLFIFLFISMEKMSIIMSYDQKMWIHGLFWTLPTYFIHLCWKESLKVRTIFQNSKVFSLYELPQSPLKCCQAHK